MRKPDNEKVNFGADELRRAAVLASAAQPSQAGKVRIFHEVMAISAFVRAYQRWPEFRLKGDPEENQLALALHSLVVRLARHDGMNPPMNPIETAKAQDRAERRLKADRPSDPEFWDLSQDEPEGSA